MQASEISSTIDAICSREDKYEIVPAVKELANRGMAAEVVEEINAMDPIFFLQNPTLLFQLKRVRITINLDLSLRQYVNG